MSGRLKGALSRITNATPEEILLEYAYAEMKGKDEKHRLTTFSAGNMPDRLIFLGVYLNFEIDPKLVDLEIRESDYWLLPDRASVKKNEGQLSVIGFRYRAEGGHIVEMVSGLDMFDHQWANMCIPEIGRCHYRPVFI